MTSNEPSTPWPLVPLKRFAELVYGDALPAEKREDGGAISVYGSNGAFGSHSAANTSAPVILVGRKGSVGALNWSDEPAFAIDTVYFIDSAHIRCNLRWLYWALQTAGLHTLSQDTGVPGLSREMAYGVPLPLAPLPKQTAIAAFLDRETGKIDALVEEQERLIELLKEKRQALISHAVTKGLDPNARMKPSGVEWLGDVPDHWEVKRLRFLCDIGTGDGDTQDAERDGSYPFFVRSPSIARIDRYSHDCEAVFTSGDGAGVGKIFHHFVGRFTAHQRVYIFTRFRSVTGAFFYRYLKENFYKVALEGGAKSTVDSLRRPLIANFWMTVPPLLEQDAITKEAQQVEQKYDQMIATAERAILLLQERRNALISAAVTGKIDVRDIAT